MAGLDHHPERDFDTELRGIQTAKPFTLKLMIGVKAFFS